MEYNTQRDHLVIPEYGRNVQNMVDFALTVEDREERNTVAKAIVSVMSQVNPELGAKEDLVGKLWVHMYIISDYKLDVDYPCDLPEREEFEAKPDPMPYPQGKIRYGHFGKTVDKFIEAGKSFESGEEKDALALTIANMMKRFYLTYNQDSVEDQMIKNQLEKMSEGHLVVPEEEQLINTNFVLKSIQQSGGAQYGKQKRQQGKGHNKGHQNKGYQKGKNRNYKR